MALCFPSFDSVESFLGPGPIFAPKREDALDLFHHSSTLDSPRHVFASVNLHISPPSLVCRLHSFFDGVVRFALPIQSTSPDLELLFKGKSMTSRPGVNRKIRPPFRFTSTRPPWTCLFGKQVPLLRFFNQIPQHLFQVSFGMGHDPEVVGLHETACVLFALPSPEGYPTFASSCVAIFCHNLGASTLPWRRHRLN